MHLQPLDILVKLSYPNLKLCIIGHVGCSGIHCHFTLLLSLQIYDASHWLVDHLCTDGY